MVHVVKQGDYLSKIAKEYGFADWRALYDHPDNSAFKKKRPNPNLIYPGDEIAIPDLEKKEESAPTEQTHRFRTKVQEPVLRLVLHDLDGNGRGSLRYRLTCGSLVYDDTTGADGLVEQIIPADLDEALLELWIESETDEPDCEYTLKVGALDPVEYLTGVQARLNNLGFGCGEIDGIDGPRTKWAVRMFQDQNKLKVDGIPGPKTQAKLKEVYGC